MTHKLIHLALPSYSGMVSAQTMDSLVQELLLASTKGYILQFDQLIGSSDIAAVRNAYIGRFLHNTAAERLVYIDTDLGWEPGTIVKLLDHPVDFVVGGYRVRTDPEQYRVHFQPGPIQKRNPLTGERVRSDDPKGLIEINRAPGGLVCITRAAAEKMTEAYASLKYSDGISSSGYSWGLFDQIHKDGCRWSEDLAFCMRWQDIGGKVWLDPDLTIYHVGPKVFKGNLETYLRERAAKEPRVAP